MVVATAPRIREFKGFDGLTLRADTYGEPGRRSVILAHGGGQTRFAWGNTARHLADEGWYSIAIDLRGHGESDWCPSGNYDLEAFAHDLHAVAEQCGDQPAAVGASLGGMAFMLAEGAIDSGTFSSITLVDITPSPNQEGSDRIVAFMRAHAEEGFETLEEAADVIAEFLPHRPRPKDLSGLAKNLRLHDDGRYRWHWDPSFVSSMPDSRHRTDREWLRDAARNLSLPVHLIRGRLSDLVREEEVEDFRTLVPHMAYSDISGAAHMVAGDRNDTFMTAVVEFLSETHGDP